MHALTAADELAALLTQQNGELRRTEAGYWIGGGEDAPAAWRAFRELATQPADEPVVLLEQRCTVPAETDRLLYQTAASWRMPDLGWRQESRQSEPEVFALSFRRQFSFYDEDGEYVEMQQMALTFEAVPTPALLALPREAAWGAGGAQADEWADAVERSRPFTAVVGVAAVTRLWIVQSPV